MDYVRLAQSVAEIGTQLADNVKDDMLAVTIKIVSEELASRLYTIAMLDGYAKDPPDCDFGALEMLHISPDRFGTPEELAAMPYNDFLKTRYWEVIRERKLRDVSHQCELCSGKGELHVHHKTYENHGKEIDHYQTDLIVLCKGCHAKHHDKVAGGVPA